MRKQLAVKILSSSFDRLEEIKQETGLSNAKIIEMLLDTYNTNTNIKTTLTEERVEEMIQKALANININASTNTNTTVKEKDCYILRKTHKTGKPEKETRQYQCDSIFWLVLEGYKAHFDKNGNPIPYRFTDETGKVWEPDEDELEELKQAFGKPVQIES
jgi:hypothetical protein